jgi:glycosyltransferase involved in cell wall biosynthesis
MLPRSLDTCLAQTYRNLEIVIVDDASTDDTAEVSARYAARDERVRYLRHEKNLRLPAALNTGFAAARGEYLTWTSDDNAYRPHALARMVEVLESRPDVGFLYTDFTNIDENDKPLSVARVGEPEDILSYCVVFASFMYRRAVYEKIGDYEDSLFLAEDYDYWLRAFRWFQALALHEDLYFYRRHPKSLSSVYRAKCQEATLQTKALNIPRYLAAGGVLGARAHLLTARQAFDEGRIGPARRHLWQAVRRAPLEPLRFEPGLVAGSLLGPRGFQRVRGLYRSVRRRQQQES